MNKRQQKAHLAAMALLEKDKLTDDERELFVENFHEGALVNNHMRSAHFTPWDLACDFAIEGTGATRVIDLCAGIGILSLPLYFRSKYDSKGIDLVCVEKCLEYVEIGKKLLPEATWIHGDVTDLDLLRSLGHFQLAIGNPPFGTNVKAEQPAPFYKGNDFEYIVMDIAAEIADHGAFIIPRSSSPFVISGTAGNFDIRDKTLPPRAPNLSQNKKKYLPFADQTKIDLQPGCAFDCDAYKAGWKGVSPSVEIVTSEFWLAREARDQERKFPGLAETGLFAAA